MQIAYDTIRIYILILLSSIFTLINAQELPFIGSRSLSMGHAATTLADEYALFNNPGSLGYVVQGSITAGYLNFYGVEGLCAKFLALNSSIFKGSGAIGISNFGDPFYRKNRISLGYGNTIGITGLGVSINYQNHHIEGFGSNSFLTIDAGGFTRLGTSIAVGGVVKNITQTRLSKITGEYFPTIMSIGVSYTPNSQLIINSQYDKDLYNPGLLKVGMEYRYSALSVRTGLILEPALFSFGLGFYHKKLKIDYGVANHQILSTSHVLTLSYVLRKDANN